MIVFLKKLIRSVYSWWVVNTAKRYYAQGSITVIGELEKAIEDKNWRAIRWVSYAIRKLNRTQGMPELLDQIALIKNTGLDSKRQFENLLTEIHAACFLSKTLGEAVLEVESRSNKVKSPYAKANKFCDIKTLANGDELYYEVKDASSETTTIYQKNGVIHFEPMDDDKVERWIKNQTKEADECGAHYLICRVPVWQEDASDTEEFYKEWLKRVMKTQFRIQRHVSRQEIIVKTNFSISSHLKGIYILKAFGYVKILWGDS